MLLCHSCRNTRKPCGASWRTLFLDRPSRRGLPTSLSSRLDRANSGWCRRQRPGQGGPQGPWWEQHPSKTKPRQSSRTRWRSWSGPRVASTSPLISQGTPRLIVRNAGAGRPSVSNRVSRMAKFSKPSTTRLPFLLAFPSHKTVPDCLECHQ